MNQKSVQMKITDNTVELKEKSAAFVFGERAVPADVAQKRPVRDKLLEKNEECLMDRDPIESRQTLVVNLHKDTDFTHDAFKRLVGLELEIDYFRGAEKMRREMLGNVDGTESAGGKFVVDHKPVDHRSREGAVRIEHWRESW
jgi:hypothetical protein